MEPEGWLPCSQELSTGPYPESDQSSPYHPILSNIQIKIILPVIRVQWCISCQIRKHNYEKCLLYSSVYHESEYSNLHKKYDFFQ
jgi:hypothetical protein